jgi:hypothetical protein
MKGIDVNSDAVSEKPETAPNKFTRARYLHADLVNADLIMTQSIPSRIYTWRNAMFLAIPDAPSGADK